MVKIVQLFSIYALYYDVYSDKLNLSSITRYGGDILVLDKEIMKGSVDIFILSIINKQDTYGYEIAKCIKGKSEGAYSMGEGTLYPALKRLEGKELIKSFWKENELTGKRKYYRITDEGVVTLNEKVSQWNKVTDLINIFKEG
jgi:PadR family transcriptional regulator PadR